MHVAGFSRATSKTQSVEAASRYNHSPRPSSNGTMSDVTASESIRTPTASVADSDEGDDFVYEEDTHGDVGRVIGSHQSYDTITLHPGRGHHHATSPHGAEMHMFRTGSRRAPSDKASTRSLWARELDYREIHGRRYCKEYSMPNDEVEQLRLTLQHQVLLHAFEGQLSFAPLKDPTHVLDVGTGTGEWAMRFAELYPDCEVVGTDISAIQETKGIPMNVFFEIEDAEEWDRPSEQYDLVHLRCMEGAFRDWKSIYRNVYDSLKPGGWVEVTDLGSKEGVYACFSSESPIHKMLEDYLVGAAKSGRKRGNFHLEERFFSEAGFVDIKVMEYRIPMAIHDESVGKLWLVTWLEGMEAYGLRLLTEQMGYDPDVLKDLLRQTGREVADRAQNSESCKSMMQEVRVVLARKPLTSESAT